MTVSQEIALDVASVLDLPPRPGRLSVYVAYGKERSNTALVRVVDAPTRSVSYTHLTLPTICSV